MLKPYLRRLARGLRMLRSGRTQKTAAAGSSLGPGIAEYILTFCSQSPEARGYAELHLGRFVRTLELTPKGDAQKSLLEMGAYMQMTPAFKTKVGYGSVRGCYLGPLGKADHKTVQSTDGETFDCTIDLFNAESDAYPYADGSFDTVVCCELLEHLSEDPMHLMFEVNRILKVGGHFVLSTPNIVALRAVCATLHGYHPGLFTQYTARGGGNAVEPRHAREYTPKEIGDLLAATGFAVEHLETGSYGLGRDAQHDWVIEILQKHGFSTDLRDDTIHVVGRKTGPPKDRYPSWLYT
ncbi:MAG: methyltransferase domain-containing protein [Acidobacteriota bacterium]